MFTFRHPKPFIQRPVAMQVVARKAQALPDLHTLVVEMPPIEAVTPPVVGDTESLPVK